MSQFKRGLTLSGLVVLAVTIGCAIVPYAREVKKKPNDGGLIALRTHHSDEDRAKADSLMRANCAGKDVKVTEEGEVTVGTRTESSQNRSYGETTNNGFSVGGLTFGSRSPSENTNVASETHAVKEWQISYDCIARNDAQPQIVAKKKKQR